MVDKAKHIAAAAEALAVFQQRCGTVEEHAIADLICDLGHLAEERDLDFIAEVRRGIGHWFAEHHAHTDVFAHPTPLSKSPSTQGDAVGVSCYRPNKDHR
jgi:hypothetical protein